MTTSRDEILERVRERYAAGANAVFTDQGSCCSGSAATDTITGNLYSAEEANVIPLTALNASLGCGNPTALASLEPGA